MLIPHSFDWGYLVGFTTFINDYRINVYTAILEDFYSYRQMTDEPVQDVPVDYKKWHGNWALANNLIWLIPLALSKETIRI